LNAGYLSGRLDVEKVVKVMRAPREAYGYDIFETSMGWAGLLVSSRGVRRCAIRSTPDQAVAALVPDVEVAEQDEEAIASAKDLLLAYLRGEAVSVESVPLDTSGVPPFLAAAWDACRRIPRGETRSYKWLAEQAGRPLAPRAAGQAMARNRFSLFVPCHRVIASDGSLGGYGNGSAGLRVKRRLLEMEGAL
jgi:O-6-methylguanine DNA methyltransferase